jgi:hypothetical protein
MRNRSWCLNGYQLVCPRGIDPSLRVPPFHRARLPGACFGDAASLCIHRNDRALALLRLCGRLFPRASRASHAGATSSGALPGGQRRWQCFPAKIRGPRGPLACAIAGHFAGCCPLPRSLGLLDEARYGRCARGWMFMRECPLPNERATRARHNLSLPILPALYRLGLSGGTDLQTGGRGFLRRQRRALCAPL